MIFVTPTAWAVAADRYIRSITDDTAQATRETGAEFEIPGGAPMQLANYVLDEIEEMFDRIDENGDRGIAFDEFAGFMREIDHSRSESALRLSFAAIDTDRDGRVSFEEFRAWMAPGR
jgi:hypothetical protein